VVSGRRRALRVAVAGLALATVSVDLSGRIIDQRAAAWQAASRQAAIRIDARVAERALRALSDPRPGEVWDFPDDAAAPAKPLASASYREALTQLSVRRAWQAAQRVPREGAPPFPVAEAEGERFLVLSYPSGRLVVPWARLQPEGIDQQLSWGARPDDRAIPALGGGLRLLGETSGPLWVTPPPAPSTLRADDIARLLAALALLGWLVVEGAAAALRRDRERAAERAREQLLQRISHELRTPAAGVLVLAEALQSGAVADPAERERFLEVLAGEAARLAGGLDQLLRAARGADPATASTTASTTTSTTARAEMDLAAWARAAAARWADRLPELTLEAPESLPILADVRRLDEAADALLDNARKYGAPPVTLSVSAAGERILLAVSDSGPGVPPGDRARIFERLERGDREGTPGGYGLGLWAVAEVARAHGGTAQLEGGSRFVLDLPAST